MGNSRSGVDFVIKLDRDFYFSSQTVNGTLSFNAKKKFSATKIVLQIEGTESCHFTTIGGQATSSTKTLILSSCVLAEFGNN